MSTFLGVVELLLTDDAAKVAFGSDPDGFLHEHGLAELDAVEVADAMRYAADALPMSVASQLDPQQGLGSAAGIDLEALGASLEREPIVYDDVDPPGDIDPHALDEPADTFGDDVEFDVPSEADAPDATPVPEPEVRAETNELVETADGVLPDLPRDDHPTDPDADLPGSELTDIGAVVESDPTVELDDADDLPFGFDTDDLDTDLVSDLSDDLDLLD